MELTIGTINIDHYHRLIDKHRWFVIIPVMITLIIGLFLSFTLPRLYRTNTLILVQPPRVPSNYVRSLVTENLGSRVSTISQQILSRTNLEKIIDEFQLFNDPKYDFMYLEDKIEDLRKRISVRVTRAHGSMDAFSITFEGEDPDKIVKVANALAAFFIDENLKVREAHAVGTENFLNDELRNMRNRLEQVEEAFREYRTNYMGELPEQLPTNLRILDRLQEQLRIKDERLSQSKMRQSQLKSELAAFKTPGGNPNIQSSNPEINQLVQMKQQLVELNTRYTAKHPDILRLKEMINDLENKIEKSSNVKEQESVVLLDQELQERRRNLRQQLHSTNNEIKNLEIELKKIQVELGQIHQRVENTPKREQELMSLRRDYNNIQESYNSLLNRKLEAELAVNMERKQKGEQFHIVDTAKRPERAVSPNIVTLFLGSLAVGLGIGIGIIFLIDFLDNSVRYKDEVEEITDLPVISTISKIERRDEQFKNKVNRWLTFGALGIEIVLCGIFFIFAVKGVHNTINYFSKFT